MFQSIITAMDLIPQFQKKYKLQVVNTVFLTDGEGDRCRGLFQPSNTNPETLYPLEATNIIAKQTNQYTWKTEVTMIMTDPVTKNQERVDCRNEREDMTRGLIRMLKARTGCNVLGFYVLSGREFNRNGVDRFFPMVTKKEEVKAKFRKEKSLVVTNAGFDEYYLLRSEGLDTDADVDFDTNGKTTTRSLVSAFTKYAGNRHNNRVVLNRFIGMIA